MKIYQTNAALGYNQLAYLVRLDNSENGHDYMCIGTKNTSESDPYRVGEIVEDLDDIYIEEYDVMRSAYFDIPDREMSYSTYSTKAYFDEQGWFLIDSDGNKRYEDYKWLKLF